MRLSPLPPRLATAQAAWLVDEEPWRGLGYEAGPLGRWLGRKAKSGQVRGAIERGEVVGLIVVQPEVLLGRFIALLAVRAAAAGRGIGRALIEDELGRLARLGVRWLYTSSDAGNRGAAAFYRRLGFVRVGRLPDLVRVGHTDILWRRAVG
ncbi:MAG TPA: GNAT family N-acetyltransferase [Polyangia bacterium]